MLINTTVVEYFLSDINEHFPVVQVGNLREISLIKQKLLINKFYVIKFHIWFEQKRLNISLMSWAYGSKLIFSIIILAMTN